MKARKMISIILTGIVAASMLVGCGAGTSNSKKNDTEKTTSDKAAGPSSDNSSANKTTDGSGKTLVVYYSATGNTKSVAETIAKITDGDLFEIEPKEPYTDDDLDWTDDDSRVSKEHDDESLRDVELVSTTVDNWESYDTVYIGYPIWWGIAAWPVDNFVKDNDFTGKTVIPFCTAASSGIGDSGNLLEKMAGTGDWKDGERFHGGASESDISSWIDGLEL